MPVAIFLSSFFTGLTIGGAIALYILARAERMSVDSTLDLLEDCKRFNHQMGICMDALGEIYAVALTPLSKSTPQIRLNTIERACELAIHAVSAAQDED